MNISDLHSACNGHVPLILFLVRQPLRGTIPYYDAPYQSLAVNKHNFCQFFAPRVVVQTTLCTRVFRAHTFQEVEVPRQRAPAFNKPLLDMACALCAVPGAAETSQPRWTNVFAHVDLTLQWGMFPGCICWIHCIPIRGQGSAGGETVFLYRLSDFPGQRLEWCVGDCVGGHRCSGSALISGGDGNPPPERPCRDGEAGCRG